MARPADPANPPTIHKPNAPPATRRLRHGLLGALVFQIVLLLSAGTANRHMLNTDAVAYLRLAGYYAHGQTDLMISGYWGPLLSWLIAPLLKLGMAPLDSARLIMGVSAVVFWLGSVALFQSVKLPASGQILGAWIITFQTIYWSVEYISPDLLVGGLMLLALAQMLSPRWLDSRPAQIATGVGWAFAYFAKAVAFPLALGICLAVAGIKCVVGTAQPQRIFRSLALTLLVFILVAAPWLALLSLKYQTPTFSTSGRINHAIVGPKDVDRYHPFVRHFHQPEPGRVTVWEDPTKMEYHFWSPFANRAYFAHQIQLVQDNFSTVLALFLFVNYDWLAVSLLAMVGLLCCRSKWREPSFREPGWSALAALSLLIALYLPVYVKVVDQRYFYFAFPLLVALGLSTIGWLVDRNFGARKLARGLVLGVVFSLLAALPLLRLAVALAGLDNPASIHARQLADKLQAAGWRGPIAGSGMVAGGRAALYVAFFLDRPWHGDELNPTPANYRMSRARLIIIHRQQAIAAELEQDPTFHNLDQYLFASPQEATAFPLQVYETTVP